MVPGHFFFPGLEEDWPHARQCMRMNYVPENAEIERAMIILAEELDKIFG